MKSEKITNSGEPVFRRRYEDACAAAHALDLVGERWALLVMRELMTGPKRFSDLRAGLPGISANVLTQRLEGLEAIGVLIRRSLPPPANARVYELTPWGYESEPIFQALGRWAVRSPLHDPRLPFSTASLILSLRTMFSRERAAGLNARIGFRLGEETFLAKVSPEGLEVAAGPVDEADAVFTGSPAAIAGAIYGGQAIGALEKDGALTLTGDRKIAETFITLFPLPEKLPPLEK
ncbi:helix-turn-helix domain-containing protein [Telmatospirillum sp. J64-1]|uniref:winged helix-turn-helix transcriptional regulator n=1 Tax=Telmatospirillum sp. J64-1 TaxID=2502183 RepID=UPI00115ED6A3|nr:winged helix-turn-helix transcriptional regulator [Telmatospirillum sp. J64-1]